MYVYIAGTGKLANELLEKLSSHDGQIISRWPNKVESNDKSIVVHAGSGRELGNIADFCTRTSSVLVELATGSLFESTQPKFPVVLCPNTNILMLKFMYMLDRSAALFNGYKIQLTESHQAAKASVPGTAVQMANSLGVSDSSITSVRHIPTQVNELKIPHEHLSRHAFHRIDIQDGSCAISMETRVYGDSPYASGVQQIVDVIHQQELQSRVYSIIEFVENEWL